MNENPMEGNLADGGESNANSTSSQTQSQPLEATLAAEIANLRRKLDAQDGEIRALKSGKDKAVDRVERSQRETLEKLAKYLNVDESRLQEAQRQSVIDDLIAERLGGYQSANPIQGRVAEQDNSAGARSDVFTASDAIAEVESFELSANDPTFIELLRKNPNRQQVRDYILERKKPVKSPNAADIVQSPVLNGQTPKSQTALTQEYLNEMQGARGQGYQVGDAIKNKYRQQGLNVDEIIIRI